ncbi:hypothetical protein B0I35DRAFT_420360 [Stachybotrys elegans]|uniref:Uncharacterized protein n=1 Tax=Stachybotrys elegans TaxID=80388 RepID=A0A8K0T464_9HYPO|nr:hypothetical protein B0I35DRAFT_420360 [Stachybotrys elegans]
MAVYAARSTILQPPVTDASHPHPSLVTSIPPTHTHPRGSTSASAYRSPAKLVLIQPRASGSQLRASLFPIQPAAETTTIQHQTPNAKRQTTCWLLQINPQPS